MLGTRRIAEGDGRGAQGDTGVFDGSLLPIQVPVTVSGIALCKVDAGYGSIRPGDLLTTSNVAGHAMKVTDHANAHGATIGKAMTGLEEGEGLVLVLVNLH